VTGEHAKARFCVRRERPDVVVFAEAELLLEGENLHAQIGPQEADVFRPQGPWPQDDLLRYKRIDRLAELRRDLAARRKPDKGHGGGASELVGVVRSHSTSFRFNSAGQ
jgi:hypothetical protein